MKTICVIGTGYVGLVTGTCFAEWGNRVVCLDIDERKVAKLQRGEMPIYEPTLKERVTRNAAAGRLRFTTSYKDALAEAEFAFIAVPTPTSETHAGADLRYIEAAARSIAEYLDHDLIIINKSTVPVGTGDLVRAIIDEHQTSSCKWAIVSNPEFLREGSAFTDCMQPDRVVLGSGDRWAVEAVAQLYSHLGCPIVRTDLPTAEMIKYASNAMLATRISFMNEVAAICEMSGADAKMVAAGMGYDRRIGPAFLEPGLGYGGSCFPKDVKALMHMGLSVGCESKLLTAVEDINSNARLRAVDKLEAIFGTELCGLTVALWGLAFKPHTDDLREGPGIEIARTLIARGARVRAYDPEAMAGARELLPGIEYGADPCEAACMADAVILVTEWPEFVEIDFSQLKGTMRCPVIVDGRNALAADELISLGYVYCGIGRYSGPIARRPVELNLPVLAEQALAEPTFYRVTEQVDGELDGSLEEAAA